jgi:vancomycin permeability regulator SanA
LRWLWLTLLFGCTAARDLLRPYAPIDQEIREVLKQPWPKTPIDVGIALGCPANPDGTASTCERCRVKTAVRQFRKGNIQNLIFSGSAAHSPDVEADVMGDLAVKRGVPAEHVFREGRALTTWQNLRFSARIMRDHGWKTVLIISTADHMPRARRIAEYYGLSRETTGYIACDEDLPPDSDAEFAPAPSPQP